jgi:uroporphyrinogen-III synthase
VSGRREPPRVAAFRPDDGRLAEAMDLLEDLGADPVGDPMLAVEPTGATARSDADYAVLTSTTGADLVAEADWDPGDATVCAIGETTADALEARGYAVDRLPAEYSSTGLVETLGDEVAGARVEVARSDHGSAVLTEGLADAGAYVHETVLYRLVRPPEAGQSAAMAAAGALDAALFSSSLTVTHFLGVADERGERAAAIDGLNDAVVGSIGEPTRQTAERAGIDVDVVPETADFETLAGAVLDDLAEGDGRA